MKSRSPLFLMEQLVMILVFALAAAFCLQAFALSGRLSRSFQAKDNAVWKVQNAAELIKSSGKSPEDALRAAADAFETPQEKCFPECLFEVHYDSSFTACSGPDFAYCMRAEPIESDVPGLCRVRITMSGAESGEAVFSLETAWQEVKSDG